MVHQSSSLARALSLRHVVLFGLAFMAPLTVFVTYGVAIDSTKGMIPTAYAISLVVMLFTAYSYGMMSKEYPIAGSSYTFTQKGISSHLGFLVGWKRGWHSVFLSSFLRSQCQHVRSPWNHTSFVL